MCVSSGNWEGLAEVFIPSKVKVSGAYIWDENIPSISLDRYQSPRSSGAVRELGHWAGSLARLRGVGRRGRAGPRAPPTSYPQNRPPPKYILPKGHCTASFAQEIWLLKIGKQQLQWEIFGVDKLKSTMSEQPSHLPWESCLTSGFDDLI